LEGRRERFLAFVDYLGTRALYRDAVKNAGILEDRRYELEHAIQIQLQPYLADRQLEVGVFSDTVLIAGTDLETVLAASAALLNFVYRKDLYRSDVDDLRLLRGGVSHGIELRSSYLKSSPAVSVIPFYDGSLAFAFELEGVRRGSRLFLSAQCPAAATNPLRRFLFTWEHMSGFGQPTSQVLEFLWPAYVYRSAPDEMAALLQESMTLWRRAVAERNPEPHIYRETLYHFDETIKCFIRSMLCFSDQKDSHHSLAAQLAGLLPTAADRMEDCNIRFVWGIWFQLIFVLCALRLDDVHWDRIEGGLDIIRERGYLDKFAAEAGYPEYAIIQRALSRYRRKI